LQRFAASELKMIVRNVAEQMQRAKADEATASAPKAQQRKVA